RNHLIPCVVRPNQAREPDTLTASDGYGSRFRGGDSVPRLRRVGVLGLGRGRSLSLGLRLRTLGRLGAAGEDLGDPHHGIILPVAPLPSRILAAPLLESDDFWSAALFHDLDRNRRARDEWETEFRLVAAQHQHVTDLHDL